MRYSKLMAMLCCVVLLGVGSAQAQGPIDRVTYLTFSGPVTIPGRTLAAGKYTFRLADPMGNRNVVQILSHDQKMVATLLTISDIGADVSDDPYVTFKETPENMPPAIKTWFYPGTRTGWEFVYPREQAMRIARASGEPVLASDAEVEDADSMTSAEVVRIDPEGRETPVESARTADDHAGQPAQTAQDGGQRPADETAAAAPRRGDTQAEPEREGEMARQELPATGGFAPLVGSVGLAALFGALALGAWRRRSH